jgi:hypothetical protein
LNKLILPLLADALFSGRKTAFSLRRPAKQSAAYPVWGIGDPRFGHTFIPLTRRITHALASFKAMEPPAGQPGGTGLSGSKLSAGILKMIVRKNRGFAKLGWQFAGFDFRRGTGICVALAGLMLGVTQTSRGTSYTWVGASGGVWTNTSDWTPAGFPAVAGDTATFSQDFTAAYPVNLYTNAVINSLSVTDTGTGTAYGFTINSGSGSPVLTLNGSTPAISSALASGQTLQINPPVNLNTANATLTSSGAGNLYLTNAGPNFFPNLNLSGGLNVATSLRIGNVSNGVPQLATLKTGSGSLQLDLAPGSTFFTNQPSIGGTGNRIITGVGSFANAAGGAQTLVNNSDGYLDLQLGSTTVSTNFFNALAGISSISGMNGTIHIEQIHGTNNLGSANIDTHLGNNNVNLYGYNSTPASAVLNGGLFNLGTATLGLLGGLTLNVDNNTGTFNVGGLMLSSANSAYFYRGGQATVNWNDSGNTISGNIYLNSQGGGPAIFNLLGGALSPGGDFVLGTTSHNYDNSSSYLNISGGVLTVANGNALDMSVASTGGAKEYSYLTITNSGVLVFQPGSTFAPGARTPAGDTAATVSSATVNLGGGLLQLAVPVSRQNVTPTTGAGSASVVFNFNGGRLQAAANLPQIFSNFGTANSTGDAIYILSGGAVIDGNGFNVGISNNLLAGSGSTGGLTVTNSGILTLTGANTYTGPTVIAGSTLALAGGGSIGNSSALNISANGLFNFSANTNFTLGSGATLTAGSAGQSATIFGATNGTLNLGSQPVTLNFDGANPALVVAQGVLSLNGQTITVNPSFPLANGTYNLINVASGTISHSGTYTLAGTAGTGTIGFSGGNVQMTITGSARIATTTTLSGNDSPYSFFNSVMTASVAPTLASGTVQFYLDGSLFGAPVTLVNGTANIPSTIGLAGVHNITVSYSGSGLYAPSATTNAALLTINQYPAGMPTGADEADAFELYLLNNQSQYPSDFYAAVAGDDTSVGGYIANLGTNGIFADIPNYPNPVGYVLNENGTNTGWLTHLPRLVTIYKALITTNSAYFILNNPAFLTNLIPRLMTSTFAYTHVPWDITDEWNYCHTWADLCEVYALGSVCLYARQVNRLVTNTIPVNNIDAWGNRIPDLFRNGHIDTTYMTPPTGTISLTHLQFLVTGANMVWTSQGIVLKYLTQSTNSVRLEGLDATFQHIWYGLSLIGAKHESPPGWPGYTALPQMSTDYMLGEHGTPYLLVYGASHLGGMIGWRNGMVNFPRWSLPPAYGINKLYADCVVNGLAPLSQGYPDRILLSRDLTTSTEYSPSANLTSWINNIIGYGYRTNELQQLLTWNNNLGTATWPFTNHTFTHFYSSDYSCQHYPNYLVTFRGPSLRTCAIENLQNPLAGYFPQGRQIFVPLGGSYIYGNGNEYGLVSYSSTGAAPWENACDYTRIPGVTTKTVPDSAFTNYWRYVYGNTPFAGTAAANNSGVNGWEQSRYVRTDQWTNAISLSGNQAVFYLDMAVVHLGAGFDNTQDANPTTTSLNQCLSATNTITYGLNDGSTQSIPSTGGGVTNSAITWALYQGVGYLPPTNGVKVLRDVMQNSAARIFSFYDDQSSPATNNLTFDWEVLPGISQATLATYSTNASRPWVIVTNTPGLQALSVPSENWLGAVFHTNTATLYASNLTVSVSRPTVLLITTTTNQLATIYVGDPYENMVAPYTNTIVPFTNAAQLVTQVTVTINTNPFTLTLPQYPNIGKTAVATVSLSATNIAPVIVCQPASTNALVVSAAIFTTIAAGKPSPVYQWQRNNANLIGATNSTYSFTAAVADNNASFRCIATNISGAVTSTPAILTVNDTPSITPIADQFIPMNGASSPLPFTVGDSFTPASQLAVTETSSNPSLIPNANVDFAGSGSNRFVTVTPLANQIGYGTINISVSDGTLSTNTSFMVVVKATNLPPVLLPIANRAVIAGTNLAIASQAGDPNSPASPIKFTLLTKPAGAGINTSVGLVSWRPMISQGGTSNQFTVVVTNALSLAATQSYWVGVIPPRNPTLSAPNFSGGQFQFTITGDAGPDYTILGTTNLTAGWQTLVTSNSPVLPFQWIDPNSVRPQFYYRVSLGP